MIGKDTTHSMARPAEIDTSKRRVATPNSLRKVVEKMIRILKIGPLFAKETTAISRKFTPFVRRIRFPH